VRQIDEVGENVGGEVSVVATKRERTDLLWRF
jgi:hypothetical protein